MLEYRDQIQKSGKLILIKIPFEDIIRYLSVINKSRNFSAGNQIKQPNFS